MFGTDHFFKMFSLFCFTLFLLLTVILILTADEHYSRFILAFIFVFGSVILLMFCDIFGRLSFINPALYKLETFLSLLFVLLTMFYISNLDVNFETDNNCSNLTPERKQKIVHVVYFFCTSVFQPRGRQHSSRCTPSPARRRPAAGRGTLVSVSSSWATEESSTSVPGCWWTGVTPPSAPPPCRTTPALWLKIKIWTSLFALTDVN